MKKLSLITALTAALSVMTLGYAANGGIRRRPLKEQNIALMTYNIRHGEGIDGITDYGRIADIIKNSGANIVAMQEIDSVTGRSGGADVLKEIASRTGMHATFARAIPFMGGAYGIGIISAEEPMAVTRIPLPGREEARVLLIAEFKDYYIGCMHLSLTPKDQMASLPIICREAAKLDKPFIIAGDWNAAPKDKFIKRLKKYATVLNNTDMPTFPANNPDTLLDYVAAWKKTKAQYKVRQTEFMVIADTVASDHRPVFTRIKLSK